jgi:hypothetical protein
MKVRVPEAKFATRAESFVSNQSHKIAMMEVTGNDKTKPPSFPERLPSSLAAQISIPLTTILKIAIMLANGYTSF